MRLNFTIGGRNYSVAPDRGHDISVAVRFDGAGGGVFGAPAAHGDAFRAGDFIGDVRSGGSCNCELYTFSPHLHGTHTECVGHIARERIAVHEALTESLIPATLVTVMPEKDAGDMVIMRQALERILQESDPDFLGALVVQTNSREIEDPPFFSREAMEYIVELGVRHLLVDLPSVDKRNDGGRLENHRIFWGVAQGETHVGVPSRKTITELIAVPGDVADGRYLLNLQVAAFRGDAAPSRPVLFEISGDEHDLPG